MEAALLPADTEAGFQFSIDNFNDSWETVEEPEQDPLDDQMGPWAHKQYLDKYSWKDEDGEPTEVWPDTAYRVVRHELGALGYTDHDPEFQALVKLVVERKLLPGGRKLAQAGRQFHQTNNCFAGDTRFLTDQGMMSLVEAYATDARIQVRNRFGEWEDAQVQRFGEQELHRVIFSNGDQVDATWDHRWWQLDGSRVTTGELESVPFGVATDLPELDPEGVRHGIVYGDGTLDPGGRHSRWDVVNPEKDKILIGWFDQEDREVVVGGGAVRTYPTIRQTVRGPKVALQPAHYKSLPETYTPEYARGFIAGLLATDGNVCSRCSTTIAQEGPATARKIAEIAVAGGFVVSSVRITSKVSPYDGSEREMCTVSIKPFSTEGAVLLPSHQAELNPNQRRRGMSLSVESVESVGMAPVYCVVAPNSESFTLANGLITSNCFLYRCEDSREGWADLVRKSILSLSCGGGIGVVYSDVRPNNTRIKKTGGVATGPLSPANMVNEIARHVMQGGQRRSAIWGGLHWNHPDVFDWIHCKDWSDEVRAAKAVDQHAHAEMDMTNISVILDTEFFEAYKDDAHPQHELAQRVYWETTANMVKNGEPGFSIDAGENEGENLRNACTELTSSDDSDICNLGSINLARVKTLDEFKEIVRLATLLLLASTVYSDVPHSEIKGTREKNRRLGLGLMGLHEWLLVRGYRYEMVPELREWLAEYEKSTEIAAEWADQHNLSRPVKTRAIAPNGTIGIIAETTTSAEPIFCVAYKRRFLDTDRLWKYQYVIDPTAYHLIEEMGVAPDDIEDAYSLAYNVERRIKFQADLQDYVDHGISSTINLPYPITDEQEVRDFGETLMTYLPRLRGVSAYPNGSRSGQPLEAVAYEQAIGKAGLTFEDSRDEACVGGSCGV